jgi:hypothetical protein
MNPVMRFSKMSLLGDHLAGDASFIFVMSPGRPSSAVVAGVNDKLTPFVFSQEKKKTTLPLLFLGQAASTATVANTPRSIRWQARMFRQLYLSCIIQRSGCRSPAVGWIGS